MEKDAIATLIDEYGKLFGKYAVLQTVVDSLKETVKLQGDHVYKLIERVGRLEQKPLPCPQVGDGDADDAENDCPPCRTLPVEPCGCCYEGYERGDS